MCTTPTSLKSRIRHVHARLKVHDLLFVAGLLGLFAVGWTLITDSFVSAMAADWHAASIRALLIGSGVAPVGFLLFRHRARSTGIRQRQHDAMARAYELLFRRHSLPAWVCHVDSGEILAVNPAAETALEAFTGDPVGRPLADVLGHDPDADDTLVQMQHDGGERAFRLLSVPCTFAEAPAILYLAHEMTADRAALARAHRYSEEMKLLTRRLLNAQEGERRDIARQLHDQLGQTLTVARLLVESTLERIDDSELSAILGDAMQALETGLKETRTLTGNLRPPMLDDLGLIPTLRWLVDHITAGSGVSIRLDLPADVGPQASEIDIAAYRIAQEAITNAMQHGEPGHLRIRLRMRRRLLTLSIEDDGRGFDAARVPEGLIPFGRSGLLGARERAEALGGGLRIRSQPGRGTVVRVILPRAPHPH